MAEIKEQYNKLKSKYNLPEFKELDKEFGISNIENEEFLLREIIDKIVERVDGFSRILEGLLQPDTSILWSLYESKSFEQKDKENIFQLYQKLMMLNRESMEISLKRDEKEEAVFISKIFNEWKGLKTDLLRVVNGMKDSWKKETDAGEKLGYLG